MNEELLNESYLFESVLRDTGRKDSTNLYFHIRPKERSLGIPHIHIFNILNPTEKELKSKKYFECCIQLNKCAYWNHEPQHRKIPNIKLRDSIVKFLNSITSETKTQTVWEYCKDMWNVSHYDKELDSMKAPPDYSKLSTGSGR